MTPVVEARTDLQAWLSGTWRYDLADTQTTIGRTQPGSQPPWNAEVANVLLDIHAGSRELEQDLRYQLSGTFIVRGGSDANTIIAITMAERLAEATGRAAEVARIFNGWITMLRQLPAIDQEERSRKVPAPCPRCTRPMLRVYERSGRVACLGCSTRGWMMPGTVSDGYIEWEDGTIT